MKKSIPANGLKLAAYACLCTGAIVIANYLTAPTIRHQQDAALTKMLSEMLPAGSFDNNLQQTCHLVQNSQLGDTPERVFTATQSGQTSAYIIESTAPDGYSGKIRLLSSISTQGEVLRVNVLEEHETPGLGDKIERSQTHWLDSFNGQTIHQEHDPSWAVKKDGGRFDSFTGATITPRAVVNQLRRVIELVKYHPETLQHGSTCQ